MTARIIKREVFNYTDCGEEPFACGSCDSCTGMPGRFADQYVTVADECHHFGPCSCPNRP